MNRLITDETITVYVRKDRDIFKLSKNLLSIFNHSSKLLLKESSRKVWKRLWSSLDGSMEAIGGAVSYIYRGSFGSHSRLQTWSSIDILIQLVKLCETPQVKNLKTAAEHELSEMLTRFDREVLEVKDVELAFQLLAPESKTMEIVMDHVTTGILSQVHAFG